MRQVPGFKRSPRPGCRDAGFVALIALLAGLGGCGNSQSLATNPATEPARTPVLRCAPATAADLSVADCAPPTTGDRS